ncbi:MAG TPA: trypsin-like peptidase domain-containing protein, partial [Candidatus Hydrogenedentes bacterium]|nr:trypsin-like peptidase domain-containing protein [Candidatus Hydrogenedentota bacterium]
SPDGYVVTNEHVAGDSTSVQCVLSDNRELDAQVVGTDPDTDVAVLKLQGEGPFPFVKWGQSGSVESGQVALAFGSPHGL